MCDINTINKGGGGDQDSHCHEKSWNLKIHFPGLEKPWILGKMAEVMNGKFMDLYFLVQMFNCAV